MQILDYNLKCLSEESPEEYQVFSYPKTRVGSVHLRKGILRAFYKNEIVYHTSFDDVWKCCFENNEEREFFLTEAVKAIHNHVQLEKRSTKCKS